MADVPGGSFNYKIPKPISAMYCNINQQILFLNKFMYCALFAKVKTKVKTDIDSCQ
jgi:hypothetical protein